MINGAYSKKKREKRLTPTSWLLKTAGPPESPKQKINPILVPLRHQYYYYTPLHAPLPTPANKQTTPSESLPVLS